MEDPPTDISANRNADPAECDTVKKKSSGTTTGSNGHPPGAVPCGLPTTLQLQGQALKPCEVSLEEKVDMVKKMKCEAADVFILMHRIEGEYLQQNKIICNCSITIPNATRVFWLSEFNIPLWGGGGGGA